MCSGESHFNFSLRGKVTETVHRPQLLKRKESRSGLEPFQSQRGGWLGWDDRSARGHTHTHAHAHACTHSHVRAHTHTHAHIHTHAQAPTHARACTHTRINTHTHTHTHTCMHAQPKRSIIVQFSVLISGDTRAHSGPIPDGPASGAD